MGKESLECGTETIVDVGVELKDAMPDGRQSETQEARYHISRR